MPVSTSFDRRRRNSQIDQLSLVEVVTRLELFDVADLSAITVIARSVLKRHLDEQEEQLKRTSAASDRH